MSRKHDAAVVGYMSFPQEFAMMIFLDGGHPYGTVLHHVWRLCACIEQNPQVYFHACPPRFHFQTGSAAILPAGGCRDCR